MVVVAAMSGSRKRIGIQEENGLETKPEDDLNEEATATCAELPVNRIQECRNGTDERTAVVLLCRIIRDLRHSHAGFCLSFPGFDTKAAHTSVCGVVARSIMISSLGS